jgi:hypothetical protein
MQHSCTVCVEPTIGSDIVLDAPDGTLGHMGHVKSHLLSFGDCVSVVAILVHSLR